MWKISLWSVDYIINESTSNFYLISNSVEISLVGWGPGLNNAYFWLIGPIGTNFCGLCIKIQTCLCTKCIWKVPPAKYHQFYLGLNVLTNVSFSGIGYGHWWHYPGTLSFLPPSLLLILRSDTHRLHLRVPDLQRTRSDLTKRVDTRIMMTVMTTRATCSISDCWCWLWCFQPARMDARRVPMMVAAWSVTTMAAEQVTNRMEWTASVSTSW